ncbi:type II toxin-antitoxin system VapC family toxin [Desulfococcaceae bacterium HSG8]|nr:type II toxin-antitoxin system VapC family toxin [Desulfococcaceae bacterium HSG8]
MKNILIDTNAYSRFLGGDDKVLNVLSEAEVVYMSVFVLGELYAGFRGGTREQENKRLLRRFLRKPIVSLLDANDETAEIFGMIKDALKRAGTPLPINDVWIASHALQTGSVVVTYDSHFKNIPGIRLWDL